MTIVRFAPSPTGLLHVGNARMALVNWLYARAHDGKFILRLDDTDAERSTDAFAKAIEHDLDWLGLDRDDLARQSERLVSYAAAFEKLKEADLVYACYETPEELAYKRKRQLKRGRPPIYDRAALDLTGDDRAKLAAEGRKAHWRFKLQHAEIAFDDLVRGPVSFDGANLSDPVIRRGDGSFLYMLPSTVDDMEMNITHIIRGEDHVANSAVQIQLFEALSGQAPVFAHLPLMTDIRGAGLSKRLGSITLETLRDDGIEPLALVCYLAHLGTSDDVALFAHMEALAKSFDITHSGRASPKFDFDRLIALNAKLLHGLDFADVRDRLAEMGLADAGEEFWLAVRANLQRLTDAAGWHGVCYGDIQPVIEDEDWEFCAAAAGLLPPEPWGEDTWKAWTGAVKDKTGRRGRDLFRPLRLALTGAEHGPEMKALLPIIGRERAIARLTVLRIYNTLARRKQVFRPLNPSHVRMYVCGPTVYDYAHIGNARPVVVFDVLYRLLKKLYPKVTYVRNITDVDDKINAAAAAAGEDISAITKRTTEAFHADIAALGTLAPDHEPRATDNIPGMIKMIEALLASENAYEADGRVLFSVLSWPDYGGLSRNDRDQIIAGARVEVAPYKRDPADFVLWKPSTADLPGWDSPWGRGRPGWHLECSVMSARYLGKEFDIHGGGQDLIFPHHENEIAQSRCAHGTDIMAKYWVHNGYVMSEGEKMSKSLGNFYTVHELLKEFPGEAVRLALLKTHYRRPLDFTRDGLAEARRELDRFYGALRKVGPITSKDPDDIPQSVKDALQDDLNTPLAIHRMHNLLHILNLEIERGGSSKEKIIAGTKGSLLAAGKVLGILQQDPEDWFRWTPEGAETISAAEIEKMIAARSKARAEKDFAESDRIRDELLEQGVVLGDGPDGTIWRRA
jgi:cysteinyl-tRNA synthetase